VYIFNDKTDIVYDITTQKVVSIDIPNKVSRLSEIHTKLTLNHGSFEDEYPEQVMVADFLKGHEKVLELGANIGRNTLVIASILKNSKNLVTLECDPTIAAQLKENRDLNSLEFHIENSALSMRSLIQKEWETMVSDTVLDGYTKVNTISYEQLLAKYSIDFDTLVADCEGALYYIFSDMPEMLRNINLVIMENDYYVLEHKEFVDSVLVKYGFERVYSEGYGWGPCSDNFYEVWQKQTA
jgi:FkbM family methyltransferase